MPAPLPVQRSARHVYSYYAALPAWAALAVLFISSGWLRAAAEKVLDVAWWNGSTIHGFLTEHADATVPFYGLFADGIVRPMAGPVAWGVAAVQVAVGVALLIGWRPRAALVAGMSLNLHFVLAGAVSPSAFYLVIQGSLLLWFIDADRRAVRAHARTWLAVLGAVVFLACVPFIRTVHPAGAIDDPALMLCFLAGLAVLAGLRLSVARPQREAVVERLDPVGLPAEMSRSAPFGAP